MEPKVVHATSVVERSFAQSPSIVFRALSEPDKVRRWNSPSEGSRLMEFRCDFREGGLQLLKYQMGPKTPIPGVVIANEARFLCIAPDERIVTAAAMRRNERLFSASLVTFELLPTVKGTDLIITHQGAFFEGSDGPVIREQGWNLLADRLSEIMAEEPPTMAGG